MKYRSLEQFIAARTRGEIPPNTMIILDNDSTYATVPDDDVPVDYHSDPHTLLREALDLLGIDYDEC